MLNIKIAMLLCMILILNHAEAADNCTALGTNLNCDYACCVSGILYGVKCGTYGECWAQNAAKN